MGFCALINNTTGNSNAAFGCRALQLNTAGCYNTSLGMNSLFSNTTGCRNTAVGYGTLVCNTTACNNTALGYQALRQNTASNNTAVGFCALRSNTTGCYNTGLGVYSLRCNTTGYQNTALGVSALRCNTTGANNTSVGTFALQKNTGGARNVAIGLSALINNATGIENVAVGVNAMYGNTSGYSNVGIGYRALVSASGFRNIAIGQNSLANTTGNTNIGIGIAAGCCITSGACNVILGSASGNGFGTQNNNIFISDGAGNIRMFVTGSNGNVGIGTTSPSEKLQINGSIRLDDGSADGPQLKLASSGYSDWNIDNYNSSLRAYYGSTEYIRLTSTGNLGIGTTNPSYKLDVSGDARITGNTITYAQFNNQGVNMYTLVAGDDSKIVEMNINIANTVTVPTNASVGFPVGAEITIIQQGTGQTTIAAAAGVTLRSAGGLLNLASQYSAATLIKRGTDEWYVVGDLA